MPRLIGVVDYGAGNLFSVERGIRAAGCAAEFVSDPDRIAAFDAVLLPGVGAFGAAMERMRARGMDAAVVTYAGRGKPLLGVCLGMQFLMTRSLEFGEHRGLDLIPGDTVEIPRLSGWPVPNVGWCAVTLARPPTKTPFARTPGGADFYFAHSYRCVPSDPRDVVGTIDYAGVPVAAMVSRENVHGCQFHPEISAEQGLGVYRTLQEMA